MSSLVCCCRGCIDRGDVDLGLTLAIYNYGFWFNGERGIVVVDEDKPVIAFIDVNGCYSIYARECSGCNTYVERLEWILSVREDLSGFYRLASSDPLLKMFSSRYRGWRPRSTSLWWSLVIGVCQQNASFWQGWRMLYNIVKLYNRRVRVDDEPILPPRPVDVLENPHLLVTAGTGYRSDTIVRIAKAMESGEVNYDRLASRSSIEIESVLKRIKGVGSYTARLSLVLAFRKYDLPPIDRWLKKIIAVVYRVREEDAERTWISRWGRWSGLASLVTTIALDAKPLRKALERIRSGKLVPIDNGSPSPTTLWRILK